MVQQTFDEFFKSYVKAVGKSTLSYRITSLDRPGNPKTNPHAAPGNALDCILRLGNDYAPITEYKALLRYAIKKWPYRMGADITPDNGNVHIHVDMGAVLPEGQRMPFFFIEDNQRFTNEIKSI